MAGTLRLICTSDAVAEAGKGFRFAVERFGRDADAFLVRFNGRVFGYFNECGHIPAQLDWQPGEFFDDSKLYLICSVHGALYAADSGRCLAGRCQGRGLKPLNIRETDGQIFLELKENHG